MPSAVISGVGSLVSGIIGSNAASAAGKTISREGNAVGNQLQATTAQGQTGATQAASAAQGIVQSGATTANNNLANVFTGQSQATSPYQTVGGTATSMLNAAYQPGGSLSSTFSAPTAAQAASTPGYQFQLQQGQQAIQRQAAASGQLNSGATGKSLANYTEGLASTNYQQAYNNSLNAYQTNYSNNLNSLTAGANIGLQGTGMYNTAASNYGNQTSANTMNAAQYEGTAGTQAAEYSGTLGLQGQTAAGNYFMQGAEGTAAGQMGSANAWQNAINGISGAAGGYFGGSGTSGVQNMQMPAGYNTGYQIPAPTYYPSAPTVGANNYALPGGQY
jgi:hypothetical protein